MVPSILSDISDAAPVLENWLRVLDGGEFQPKIAEFRKTIHKSKKGVRELRKRPFQLVDTTEHLNKEIADAKGILDSVDKATSAIERELSKLDFQKVVHAAIKSTKRAGPTVNPAELPSFDPLKSTFVQITRLSIIGTLAVAFTAILDPLESVTR